jgi:LCP family protein required for cell wall assembly
MSDAPKPGSDDVTSGPSDDATETVSVARRRAPTSGTIAASPPRPPRVAGRRKAEPPRTFLRRHKMWVALAVVLAVLAGGAGGWYWYLNHQLNAIPRVDAGIAHNAAKDHNEGGQPLNILLLGADKGEQTVEEDLEDGEWSPFSHRSDTIILVHIPADRRSVQVVSIPRDTWVRIPGYPNSDGFGKINAAFAYGGPPLATEVVQTLTGLQLDHLAIIDWEGFKDLTRALGGVRVYIPEAFHDDKQDIDWEAGWERLSGERALQYVRTRDGLENGDIGRIARQQNFLRATMGKLLSAGTTRNPVTLTKVVNIVAGYMTVDEGWDTDEIRSMALSLRNISADDVTFLTMPYRTLNGRSPDGQSIVELNMPQVRAMMAAVQRDTVDEYLAAHPEDELPDDRSVN